MQRATHGDGGLGASHSIIEQRNQAAGTHRKKPKMITNGRSGLYTISTLSYPTTKRKVLLSHSSVLTKNKHKTKG